MGGCCCCGGGDWVEGVGVWVLVVGWFGGSVFDGVGLIGGGDDGLRYGGIVVVVLVWWRGGDVVGEVIVLGWGGYFWWVDDVGLGGVSRIGVVDVLGRVGDVERGDFFLLRRSGEGWFLGRGWWVLREKINRYVVFCYLRVGWWLF